MDRRKSWIQKPLTSFKILLKESMFYIQLHVSNDCFINVLAILVNQCIAYVQLLFFIFFLYFFWLYVFVHLYLGDVLFLPLFKLFPRGPATLSMTNIILLFLSGCSLSIWKIIANLKLNFSLLLCMYTKKDYCCCCNCGQNQSPFKWLYMLLTKEEILNQPCGKGEGGLDKGNIAAILYIYLPREYQELKCPFSFSAACIIFPWMEFWLRDCLQLLTKTRMVVSTVMNF